jgi:ABC-type lipoprotein release transport system permease subunit
MRDLAFAFRMAVAAGLFLATVLASLVPAARIIRLNPADTLRSE